MEGGGHEPGCKSGKSIPDSNSAHPHRHTSRSVSLLMHSRTIVRGGVQPPPVLPHVHALADCSARARNPRRNVAGPHTAACHSTTWSASCVAACRSVPCSSNCHCSKGFSFEHGVTVLKRRGSRFFTAVHIAHCTRVQPCYWQARYNCLHARMQTHYARTAHTYHTPTPGSVCARPGMAHSSSTVCILYETQNGTFKFLQFVFCILL